MNCKLCNLPTPSPPIYDGDNAFCCLGCKSVYAVFGEAILTNRNNKGPEQEPNDSVIETNAKDAFLRIEGMHCSSCEILLEHQLKKIDGIYSISTSYATSTAKVSYDPELINKEQLPGLFSKNGYRAYFSHEKLPTSDQDLNLLRMVLAVGLAGMVMMLNLAFFYPSDLGLVSPEDLQPVSWLAFSVAPNAMLVLTTILVVFIASPILKGAWIGMRTRVLNMDNLLTIAILAAYFYSCTQLFKGDLELYFDVSAVIIAVVTVGRYLEHGARQNATQELANIINHWSPMVRVIRNQHITTRHISKLLPHEIIIVEESEAIPVDGTIVSGQSAIDESLVTGEACPVSKSIGDNVLGGSLLIQGQIEIQIGETVESRMDDLARVLWNVQSSARGAYGIGQRIAGIFVPLVLFCSSAVIIWLLSNNASTSVALMSGLATLIVSCPCTFGLAVPLTTANAISSALKKGIILSSADIFEKHDNFQSVAIDKTGTLSNGEMEVTKVLGCSLAIEYAVAIERHSNHPIAKAIARLSSHKTAEDIRIHPGRGAQGMIDGHTIAVGSQSLFNGLGWSVPEKIVDHSHLNEDEIISYIGWDGGVYGAIITRDQKRPEWQRVIKRFQQQQRVLVLTGADHPSGYDELVEETYTRVLPEAKAAIIKQVQKDGPIIMIGDGSNDAPALAAADMGIAFGTPTSLAAEAADIIIPGNNLEKVFTVLNLIKTTRRRIRQNIGWALLYNAIAIPLAISGLLNPLFAALAMACSSLLVVWNSSRSLTPNSDETAQQMSPPLLGSDNQFVFSDKQP